MKFKIYQQRADWILVVLTQSQNKRSTRSLNSTLLSFERKLESAQIFL
jgi:hypothetical protein